MPTYRIYTVVDGIFHSSVTLKNMPDDESAIEATKPLMDGHDVELWQLDRKVAVLDHRTKLPKIIFE